MSSWILFGRLFFDQVAKFVSSIIPTYLEAFNGLDFLPPVLRRYMEDILAQRLSARVTHIKYGLSQIFCMEIVKDKGHVVGIREILKNEDIRNISFLYIHFLFSDSLG